jgi:hypothetical protein
MYIIPEAREMLEGTKANEKINFHISEHGNRLLLLNPDSE